MIPRDSHAWWVVIGLAWLTSLWANPELVEQMLELHRKAWIAGIGQLIAIGAAYLKASPIHSISDEGRERFKAAAERSEADKP